MRRYNPPYNGKQFLLNKNTGEIHDLDNESTYCKIDKIKSEHVLNCISYEDAKLRAVFLGTPNPNGCYFCMRSKDNG